MQVRTTDAWRAGHLFLACLLLLLLSGMAVAQNRTSTSWPVSGHDLSDTRSQPAERQINAGNAGTLVPRWVFTTGGDVSATPTVSGDGAVYFPDWAGNLFAVGARNGRQIWSHKISDYNGQAGAISRVSPAISGGSIITGDNVSAAIQHNGAHIMSINRSNGQLQWITQVDAHPAAIITGSPVVNGGTIVVGISSNEEALAANPAYACCTFRGSLMALDAATGAIKWKTFIVPDNGGQVGGYSGGAIWGQVAIANGSVFTATGNNYDVPADVKTCQQQAIANNDPNANCTAPDDFFETALALDPATGAIKWANRLSSFDAWTVACIGTPTAANCPSPTGPEFDFGDGPNYISGVNLVGFGQKSGIYWALDPSSGRIVWATAVGPGGTTGGIQWGSETDGSHVYVQITNSAHQNYTLTNGQTITWGAWSALDARTGQILW